MQTSTDTPRQGSAKWVYVILRVRDGERVLKPSHVSFDHIRFNEPPHLTGSQVEVILTNGADEQRQMVVVLPHDANETRIPIRLLTE